jgi:hypothetical protein
METKTDGWLNSSRVFAKYAVIMARDTSDVYCNATALWNDYFDVENRDAEWVDENIDDIGDALEWLADIRHPDFLAADIYACRLRHYGIAPGWELEDGRIVRAEDN